MTAYVIVATKNRAKETYVLLDYLARQTLAPAHTWLIGSEAKDIQGLAAHPLVVNGHATLLLSDVGSTVQRNAGLDALSASLTGSQSNSDWFVTFFDDDFRPATDWLENAHTEFQRNPAIAGLTGCVLADGIKSEFGINEHDAALYLKGEKEPLANWSNSGEGRVLDGLYGCNMAVRGSAAISIRFDERLPMYAWQEDADFSSRASSHGQMVLYPPCRGVHMGSSSGRTSGVRFGYSQIANPIFLAKKGTMSWARARNLMIRNIVSNVAKTLTMNRIKDFPGRLRGNLRAGLHLLLGKLDPEHIVHM